MKVAINRCYGGFGLSVKAIEELVKNYPNCPGIKSFTYEEYGGKPNWKPDQFTTDSCYVTEDHIYHDDFYPDNLRTDPSLIAVIEKLGKDANGTFANIRIVEIPDDAQFEISEYDGMEQVEEVHRSWY